MGCVDASLKIELMELHECGRKAVVVQAKAPSDGASAVHQRMCDLLQGQLLGSRAVVASYTSTLWDTACVPPVLQLAEAGHLCIATSQGHLLSVAARLLNHSWAQFRAGRSYNRLWAFLGAVAAHPRLLSEPSVSKYLQRASESLQRLQSVQ